MLFNKVRTPHFMSFCICRFCSKSVDSTTIVVEAWSRCTQETIVIPFDYIICVDIPYAANE